jgi:hypothetical protein
VTRLGPEEHPRRFVREVTIPTETGNEAIRNGTLPSIVQSILEELKPEATYFFAIGAGCCAPD